jgi:hypothetical protein
MHCIIERIFRDNMVRFVCMVHAFRRVRLQCIGSSVIRAVRRPSRLRSSSSWRALSIHRREYDQPKGRSSIVTSAAVGYIDHKSMGTVKAWITKFHTFSTRRYPAIDCPG